MKKPKHKPIKKKYLDKRGSVQYNRENSPITMEDNFSMFDMPWLSTLRDRSHTAQSGKLSKRRSAVGVATVPNPPSFYDDEVNKWDKKFKKTVQDRFQFKK